jgi:CBS domain-containing protein
VETAEISYRVADFLKQRAPFSAVEDIDLLTLAANGRVKFYEPNEYILWQGEPHKPFVFVIQQGTVSLWDESGPQVGLRDVRGAGDMLGIERYLEARSCLYSARSETDVVIYAFPADDFEQHILKYPHAEQYVSAEGHATPDYQPGEARREPQQMFVHDLIAQRPLPTFRPTDGIRDAAAALLDGTSEAVAIVDTDRRAVSVITAETLLRWLAAGGGNADQPVGSLVGSTPVVVGPNTSAAEGVMALAAAEASSLAVTSDGTPAGTLQALVTDRDFAAIFGERPTTLLREVRRAGSPAELRDLHLRARALVLRFLAGPGSVEWLTRFTQALDSAIAARVISFAGGDAVSACWCFCGSSGRAESLTALAPYFLVALERAGDREQAQQIYSRTNDLLVECGYLRRADLPFDVPFLVAESDEWSQRYRDWLTSPVLQQAYRARPLFDVRPVVGPLAPWKGIETTVNEGIDLEFLNIMANDCLTSLPPLTFYEDTVVDSVGEHATTFQLERSALRPLVDVGRVFAMAGRQVFGRSTLERFALARTLLPEHEMIFREASDTLRIVLWQQGRVGISTGTDGWNLPPALLSRHDRQMLKGGFRSILRLLEFTADGKWLGEL